MLPTPSSAGLDLDRMRAHGEALFQRRLRHLTSIQIRNLTPFPVRDAFASALAQPAAHSQFTPLGNLSDDLDVALLRRRSRRISTTSVNTLKNVSVDDPISDDTRAGAEQRGRRRTQPRVGFPSGSGVVPASRPLVLVDNSSPRQTRIRTTSAVSVAATSNSVSALYLDHSQRSLEKVIKSRLVETFITIAVPEPPPSPPSPPFVNGKARSRADSGPSLTVSATGPNAAAQTSHKGARAFRSASIGAGRMLSTPTSSRISSRGKLQSTVRHLSSSSAKTHGVPSSASSAPLQKSSSHQSPLPSSDESVFPKVPNYISPIHRPSTNPLYHLDPASQSEFSENTNLSSGRLRVQLWTKVDTSTARGNGKGKQKSDDVGGIACASPRWKVLEEWDFLLSELIPLTPELENHPSQLPSNTLVMTFLPTGQSFHLSPPGWSRSRSQSRSPSPSGYNTDPELDERKRMQSTEAIPLIPHDIVRGDQPPSGVVRRSRKLEARTTNFEELRQLATLQTCIRDTEESLRDVIREIDLCLAKDHVLILKREASERQARIDDQRAEARVLTEGSNRLRDDLATRRKQIHTRRDCLAKAKAVQAEEVAILSDQVAEVTEERNNLIVVRNRIPPTRASLISALAAIYPIDLLSTSELLYTILAIPLPIPFNSNEPAPPLSLPSHKEVTEEAVATALGYAAHVVQLLSVYMGKGLVYPITYIGSRSLIRDNISAMVGPRMFPLFPKGVDTYRFEYAVFLLNKDIEMLMAERDLRALDMRHTLPNLKNLLLTLTDGESGNADDRKSRYQNSPSSLATLPRAVSPSTDRASETPKAGRSPCLPTSELPQERDSFAGDGATTPKANQGEGGTIVPSRYSKLSLGFPPLPGFFRSRNSPSILQAPAKSGTGAAEEAQGNDASAAVATSSSEDAGSSPARKSEDDDDRRTIKGVIIDAGGQSASPELKQGEGGEELKGALPAGEKVSDATTATVVVSVDSLM